MQLLHWKKGTLRMEEDWWGLRKEAGKRGNRLLAVERSRELLLNVVLEAGIDLENLGESQGRKSEVYGKGRQVEGIQAIQPLAKLYRMLLVVPEKQGEVVYAAGISD